MSAATWLTPWAAEFRYGDPPAPQLDRTAALTVAEAAESWARRAAAPSA